MTTGTKRAAESPRWHAGLGASGLTSAATSGGSPARTSAATSIHWRRLATCTALCGIGVLLAGCASQDRVAQGSPSVDRYNARYGVSSSPRVVEEGRPVPRGGGVYRVGRSYTVAGRRYTPYEKREGHTETGIASWYGRQFHGRLTANGEVYDMHTLSAAHRTMPMPSYARVTNLTNGHSLIVRVNDRGPFHGNRVIDLSQRASNMLDFRGRGLARVRVEYVGRAPLEGSDDRMLLATLRTDGSAAPRPSMGAGNTMIASASPAAPQAAAPQAANVPAPAPVQQAEAPAQEAPRGLFQLASATSAPAPQPQAASQAITMASAPMPQSRPTGIDVLPQTTVVARASRDVPQAASQSVTVVAAPATQASPQPVLAAVSSRPVAMPTASAYAPAPAPAPAIAAMPASGPVRASLGFGSLY
ncbi:MAG: septal ring lytic transglycosylase RlpA family protein [Phreatobacter sp.]|nr:septal ring lytic transglycosylase RlpA family protein [Phreatobacter sp.]